MFRKMRKEEKALDSRDINNILSTSKYGVLSVLQENQYPYGIPLNFAHNKDKIYFLSENQGNKKDSIEKNEKVSFTVISGLDSRPDSVILFGRASQIHNEEKFMAVKLLIEKHSRADSQAIDLNRGAIKDSSQDLAVFKIEVEHRTGKLGG